MPRHSLIERNNSYAKLSGILRQYQKVVPNDEITDFESLKFYK